MKTVAEWLPDFRGNMVNMFADDRMPWEAQVESEEEANKLVNARIDNLITWLRGIRRKEQ